MTGRAVFALQLSLFAIVQQRTAASFKEVPVDPSLNENEKKNAPKQYRMSDDSMEEKRKALADVDVIGNKIKCTVCQQASKNISATLASTTFRSESALLDFLKDFCGLSDKFPDYLSKVQHWQLRGSGPSSFALEPPTEAELKVGEEEQAAAKAKTSKDDGVEMTSSPPNWPEIRKTNSIRAACKKVVEDNHSELAEFLFSKAIKKGNTLPESALSDKLCIELSESCKKSKPKKRKSSAQEL